MYSFTQSCPGGKDSRCEEPPEPMGEKDHKDLDQEVDSPFDMSQIKTSDRDDEPDSERVYFVRARLEPEEKADQSGLIKSDPIMIKADIMASCAIAGPKLSETAERKKACRECYGDC